jgi:hypothetical protein
MDQSTIAEGIGGVTWGSDNDGKPGFVNVRQKHIQGYCINGATSLAVTNGRGWKVVPQQVDGVQAVKRRYQIQLGTGLFTQEKLVINYLH